MKGSLLGPDLYSMNLTGDALISNGESEFMRTNFQISSLVPSGFVTESASVSSDSIFIGSEIECRHCDMSIVRVGISSGTQ